VFILYLSQGVPVGVFFFALPGWLAANGASPADIGFFLDATSLPWTLKFINGFLMDRFAYLPMGLLDRLGGYSAMFITLAVISIIAIALVTRISPTARHRH
jgi:PAT family beta-lactamase induction signal transducer AmpG